MAFLHKISGYLVDINEEYFEEDIDKTLKHLEGRISGMQRAITGLKRIRSGE